MKREIAHRVDFAGLSCASDELPVIFRRIRRFLKKETVVGRRALLSELHATIEKFDGQPPAERAPSLYLKDTIRHIDSLDFSKPVERRAWKGERPSRAARSIPSMIDYETKQYYQWLARTITGTGAIVEIGCWLGASTRCLAEGLYRNRKLKAGSIHVYDSFLWEDWMTRYLSALQSRQLALKDGESFLETFAEYMKPLNRLVFPSAVRFPKIRWRGGPIMLLVYDLSGAYDSVCEAWGAFGPSLVAEKSIVVFNEYGNLQAEGLRRFCREQSRRLLPLHKPATSAKGFLYKG